MTNSDTPSTSAPRRRFGLHRPSWKSGVGAAIVGACALASGIAYAATSLDSLSDGSNGGTYTYTCDTTITGTHGALALTQGVTCVLHAHITGGISVAQGASVIVIGSTIDGSISESKPDGTQICGSTINGGVGVVASTGFVLIGDSANGCGKNTIVGSLLATNNHNGLVIVGNTVKGSISITNNSGAGPLPGQTGPIVSGNHH
jgi:hypothetical protein